MPIWTTGDTAYRAAMAGAAVRVGAGAATATRAAGAAIERDAKTLAPVDTGNLRASIGTNTSGDGRAGVMRVEIGPTAHYGAYVEQGTSRMAAQPYLRPATERHLPGWQAALERVMRP